MKPDSTMQTEENPVMPPVDRVDRLGIVGYGEVGRIFAAGLRKAGVSDVAVWDLKFIDPAKGPEPLAHAQVAGVRPTVLRPCAPGASSSCRP